MEEDVLWPRQARRARWPAVDARRFDRIIKGSVCCFFAFNHRQPARVTRYCVRKLLDFNCLIHGEFLSHFRPLQPIEIPQRHLSVFCFQIQKFGEAFPRIRIRKQDAECCVQSIPVRFKRQRRKPDQSLPNEISRGDHHVEGTRE